MSRTSPRRATLPPSETVRMGTHTHTHTHTHTPSPNHWAQPPPSPFHTHWASHLGHSYWPPDVTGELERFGLVPEGPCHQSTQRGLQEAQPQSVKGRDGAQPPRSTSAKPWLGSSTFLPGNIGTRGGVGLREGHRPTCSCPSLPLDFLHMFPCHLSLYFLSLSSCLSVDLRGRQSTQTPLHMTLRLSP